jgi:hypothetical protein
METTSSVAQHCQVGVVATTYQASHFIPSTQRVPGGQQNGFLFTVQIAATGQQRLPDVASALGTHWKVLLAQHSVLPQHFPELQQNPPQQA